MIFDFDGTLCDTHEAILHCTERAFAAHGEAVPERAANEAAMRAGGAMGHSVLRLAPHLAAEPERIAAIVATYRAIYDEGEGLALTRLFPGAAAMLDTLAARGFAFAIVSNKGESSVHASLEHFGLTGRFAPVIGDRAGFARKPAPDAFHAAIVPHFAVSGIGRLVMVGDAAPDLGFARAIGAEAVWAEYGFGDRAACEALAPDLRIAALADLPAALAHLPAARDAQPRL